MRCELDSCGFWLYFFLRIARIERSSSWYVWFGFSSEKSHVRSAPAVSCVPGKKLVHHHLLNEAMNAYTGTKVAVRGAAREDRWATRG